MKFAHGINSSPSSSSPSSHDRPVLQEILSAEAIEEKLGEGKAMHDCMFELEYLTEQKHSVDQELQVIHAKQHEISIEHGSHGKKLVDEDDLRISELNEQKRDLQANIQSKEIEIEIKFDRIESDGDHYIKGLFEKRRILMHQFEKKGCEAPSGIVVPVCKSIDGILGEVTYQIFAKYTEYYWSARSLGQFEASVDRMHPGEYQAHPAYLDIKAVIDGSQNIAIVAPDDETEGTDQLIAEGKLSVMFVQYPYRKIVYKADAYENARHIVSLLETRGNKSNDPEIVYNYYARMGTLLGHKKEIAYEYALKKARKVQPDFQVPN